MGKWINRLLEKVARKVFTTSLVSFDEFNAKEHEQQGGILVLIGLSLGCIIFGIYSLFIHSIHEDFIILGFFMLALCAFLYLANILEAVKRIYRKNEKEKI